MKAFETSSQISYSDAVANCKNMGFDIAQPYNDVESQTLSGVLSNFTTGFLSHGFWIGNNEQVESEQ